jgi:O-antigen/teichoic acid export membrane protein
VSSCSDNGPATAKTPQAWPVKFALFEFLPDMFIKRILKSTVARNTAWTFLGAGLRLIIQALYFIAIARVLGVSQYGAFIGVLALVGIAVPFGTLGTGNLLIKNVSRDQKRFVTYWGSALLTTALSGSVLFIAVLLLSRFSLPSDIPLRLISLVSISDILGLNIVTLCGQAFQAFDQLKWTAALNVLISAGRLIGAIVLIGVRPHPSALQWGYAYCCSTIIVAAVALLLVWSKLGAPDLNGGRSFAEIREGSYFSVSLSAQTIYNDIDKTMLARMGTLDATGIYGAAYRLIDVCFVPVSSLLVASYPNFFRAGADGITSCLRYAKPLLLRSLAYSAFICVALLLSAGAVPHILGQEYSRTTEALRWLAVLPFLKVLNYFFSNVLTGAGHQGLRTFVQVAVALFNVVINLWIIPLYSWRGAAWSSIASDALLAFGVAAAVFVLSRRSRAVPVNANADAFV